MAFDAEREFGYMYDKLDYYGQKRWLNVILPAWEAAYRTAYGRVVKVVEKKAADDFADSIVSVLGVFAGQGSFGVQLAFVPLAAGLKKLMSSEPKFPPTPSTTPEEFINDRKREFGRMLANCSGALMKLRDDAHNGRATVNEAAFSEFLSQSLLSPIWYPPGEPDTKNLADRIETRMWATIAKPMLKNAVIDMNLLGMAERLGLLKAVKDPAANMGPRNNPMNVAVGASMGFYNVRYLNDFLRPWVPRELAAPDPLDYPVPSHVKSYLTFAQRFRNPVAGLFEGIPETLIPPETIMQLAPKVRLDWKNVP